MRQTFIKVSILHYFNPKFQIHIKTNTFNYIIGRAFGQLTLDNLSR